MPKAYLARSDTSYTQRPLWNQVFHKGLRCDATSSSSVSGARHDAYGCYQLSAIQHGGTSKRIIHGQSWSSAFSSCVRYF